MRTSFRCIRNAVNPQQRNGADEDNRLCAVCVILLPLISDGFWLRQPLVVFLDELRIAGWEFPLPEPSGCFPSPSVSADARLNSSSTDRNGSMICCASLSISSGSPILGPASELADIARNAIEIVANQWIIRPSCIAHVLNLIQRWPSSLWYCRMSPPIGAAPASPPRAIRSEGRSAVAAILLATLLASLSSLLATLSLLALLALLPLALLPC